MIMNTLQKLFHKVRTPILPTIVSKVVKYKKVFLKDTLICFSSEVNVSSYTGTPLIYTAFDLIM